MNSSFLYHAWGLYSLECTKEEYKGHTIILHVQTKKRQIACPKCGKRHLVKNGYRIRDFIGLPIGGKMVIIRMKVQRYKCKNENCDYDQQENIPFATGSRTYTHCFARYVVDLLRVMTLQDTANLLNTSWDIAKEIHSIYLQRHYCPPPLEGVECIGIDEFAVRKGVGRFCRHQSSRLIVNGLRKVTGDESDAKTSIYFTTNSTGQWSEPATSVWMEAEARRGARA